MTGRSRVQEQVEGASGRHHDEAAEEAKRQFAQRQEATVRVVVNGDRGRHRTKTYSNDQADKRFLFSLYIDIRCDGYLSEAVD